MSRTLDLVSTFKIEAELLQQAREKSKLEHASGDIRAAGNEVEEAVRGFLMRFLPPGYYVTSGHLIDTLQRVSPQLDIIIADHFSLPSLFTGRDGTQYVPITSALAVGEVKSTYDRSARSLVKFVDTLAEIECMERPLIENTAYGGLSESTLFRDMTLGNPNRYLNHLYSFFFCVDGGDFAFDDVTQLLSSTPKALLPITSVFLNHGVIGYSNRSCLSEGLKYPREVEDSNYDWRFMNASVAEGGSVEGSHLAFLFCELLRHLAMSHLERPSPHAYLRTLLAMSKSSMRWAKDGGEVNA